MIDLITIQFSIAELEAIYKGLQCIKSSFMHDLHAVQTKEAKNALYSEINRLESAQAKVVRPINEARLKACEEAIKSCKNTEENKK